MRPRAAHAPARRADPRVLAAISVGAMGGATARYLLSTWIHPGANGFPWATFWTNVSGSFALGALLVVLLERLPPTRYARALLATGLLGAYTTFSTFSVEADLLVRAGRVGVAATYVGASLAAGLAAGWVGTATGRQLAHRPPRQERR